MKNVDHITDESCLCQCHEIEYGHDIDTPNSYVVRKYDNDGKSHTVVIPVETADKSIRVTDIDLAIILYHRLMMNKKENLKAAENVASLIGMLVANKTMSNVSKKILNPIIDLAVGNNNSDNNQESEKKKE